MARGPADCLLVEVRSCGVDEPIAGREGVGDGLLILSGVRNLEYAEAEEGHRDAVFKVTFCMSEPSLKYWLSWLECQVG